MDDWNLGSSPFPVKVSNNIFEFVGPQTYALIAIVTLAYSFVGFKQTHKVFVIALPKRIE